MKNKFAVAVDGPAGAGKSLISRKLANALGIIYVDTGAFYRCAALLVLENGIDPSDTEAVESCIEGISIRFEPGEEKQKVFLKNEDVTDKIRQGKITDISSKIAVIEKVRAVLSSMQKEIARENSVVMDGRDIGSFVLPNAEVKIYLDADVSVRAQRRYDEIIKSGEAADFESIKKEVAKRDIRDKNRKHSPLKKAEDAVYVDSSHMTPDEVLNRFLEIVKERMA